MIDQRTSLNTGRGTCAATADHSVIATGGDLGWRERTTVAKCERAQRTGDSPQSSGSSRDPLLRGAEEGELQGLEELLAHDVVFCGDGGGKAPAAARTIHGRAKVARLLTAGLRTLGRFGGFTTPRGDQLPARCAFFDREGRLISVMILDIADGQVQGVNAIVNPDKLQHLGPVGDLRARTAYDAVCARRASRDSRGYLVTATWVL